MEVDNFKKLVFEISSQHNGSVPRLKKIISAIDDCQEVKDFYEQLGKDRFRKLVYIIKNNLPFEIPLCPYCGKPKSFKGKGGVGFRKTCGDLTCVQKAREENNIKIVGISNLGWTAESQRKIKETNNKRFGTDYYRNSVDYKIKTEQTCLKKYGEIHHWKNREIIFKRVETIKQNHGGVGFGSDEIRLKCQHTMKLNGTEVGISNKQKQFNEFIKSLCDDEIIFNDRTTISPFELDVLIPTKKVAFEFNGAFWHSDEFHDKFYHKNKTDLCEKFGIRLFHVWEDDWDLNRDEISTKIIGVLLKTPEDIIKSLNKSEIFVIDKSWNILTEDMLKSFGFSLLSEIEPIKEPHYGNFCFNCGIKSYKYTN